MEGERGREGERKEGREWEREKGGRDSELCSMLEVF